MQKVKYGNLDEIPDPDNNISAAVYECSSCEMNIEKECNFLKLKCC